MFHLLFAISSYAPEGNRTPIYWLEANYSVHYTTGAMGEPGFEPRSPRSKRGRITKLPHKPMMEVIGFEPISTVISSNGIGTANTYYFTNTYFSLNRHMSDLETVMLPITSYFHEPRVIRTLSLSFEGKEFIH